MGNTDSKEEEVTPQRGDIIRIPRDYAYDHFAVYKGDGMVIHRAGNGNSKNDPKAVIRIQPLRDVVGKSGRAELANYMDKTKTPLARDEIVRRAEARVGEKGYDLVTKNCEHFATWCRYGEIGTQPREGVSEQVNHYAHNIGTGIVDDCPEYVLDQMPERGPRIALN